MNKLIASLTFLTMLIIGVGIIYYQDYQADYKLAASNAEEAVNNIEKVINEAQQTAEFSIPLLRRSCTPDVIRKLNMMAARESHLRTVSLIKDNVVYCSSLFGVDHRPAMLERFYKGQLALLAGNTVTPNTPLLMYLKTTPNGSVGIGIHVPPLISVLNFLSKRRSLYMQAGYTWISVDGKVMPFNPDNHRNFVIIPSNRYHFAVLFSSTDDYSLNDFWHQEKMTFLVILLISLSSGVLTYKYLTQSKSPYDEIKRAIRNQEIIPFYQPVITTESREIYGFEVLARWNHPRTGIISPDVFIPLCEQSGLIIPLTRSLMNRVIQDLSLYLDKLPDGLHIGINISAQHCQYDDFITDCQNFMDALGDKKIRLMVEITEREKIDITPETISFFKKLSAAGILIALDDFGTGYSNFDYLRKLQVNIIKIDKSFVSMINREDPQASVLVNCVIDMAQKMRLVTIAEGVETEFQAEFLSSRKIDFLQGYLFSIPMPFAELVKTWLDKP
ncbi:EAL domain-containing protein [Pectobacteriaceae bacterium CE90]|nr:EAL domain-containing protein [Pectobacteriaceae bacterium CE90]